MAVDRIKEHWNRLYPGETQERDQLLHDLATLKASMPRESRPFPVSGLVYCAYADAFGNGLDGVTAQMPRLKGLGVSILWLLPLLDSPGRDQGFDIRDYQRVAPRLGGNEALARLLAAAALHEIAVVFDIAVNHTSDEHPWFLSAQDPQSPYRDYYLWSDTGTEYAQAPLIFPGMVPRNWTWKPEAQGWYFHRFYPFQPDLNYHNPRVASEMVRILASWKAFGVNGFRMDAAALLWKEEGTTCDSLPQVHWLLKLFQACLDELAPGSLLLAEANVPAAALRDYFGDGDECKAAYHFELMPQFYQALLHRDPRRLANASFPPLPSGAAWFTFLRVHDEVTLDLVPPAQRAELVEAYAPDPTTRFRQDQAFSGRLFELLGKDPDAVTAAWSLLVSLPGTPILYYGDEMGMENSWPYFHETAAATGFPDTRFLHRGPWDAALDAQTASEPASPRGRLRRRLEILFHLRRDAPELAAQPPVLTVEGATLVSTRTRGPRSLVLRTNLATRSCQWILDGKTVPLP